MKFSPRIAAPILLALGCAGVIIAALWWQLEQATTLVHSSLTAETPSISVEQMAVPLPSTKSYTGGNTSLIHLRRGDLLALRGEWKAAQEEFVQAVEADGGVPALRKLAQAQLQRRDIDGVHGTLRQLKSAGARQEDLLLLESIVFLRTGELQRARTFLNTAPESPQQQYGLALLSLLEGDHERAQAAFLRVEEGWEPILRSYAKLLNEAYAEYALFPESPETHLITLLSRALAQVRECELALPLLQQVTDRDDDYRDAWIVQGYCELMTERFAQAKESLDQAYTIDPQKPETQYFLGKTALALGEFQNAITFFEYAIANGFSPEAEARHAIANAAIAGSNKPLALEQYAALTAMSNVTIEAFEGYVSTALELEQIEKASLKANEALVLWPELGRAHILLGRTALAAGNREQGKNALKRALELDPFLMEAKRLLGE